MEMDLEKIRTQFDSVLNGDITREIAADWARRIREADDRSELQVNPESNRKIVWKAIEFLEMYDMKTSPTEYMYGEEDLAEHRP